MCVCLMIDAYTRMCVCVCVCVCVCCLLEIDDDDDDDVDDDDDDDDGDDRLSRRDVSFLLHVKSHCIIFYDL